MDDIKVLCTKQSRLIMHKEMPPTDMQLDMMSTTRLKVVECKKSDDPAMRIRLFSYMMIDNKVLDMLQRRSPVSDVIAVQYGAPSV